VRRKCSRRPRQAASLLTAGEALQLIEPVEDDVELVGTPFRANEEESVSVGMDIVVPRRRDLRQLA
jgi:hypothetical protein